MAQANAIGDGSFAEGTRIAVPAGEIAVERLAAGDLLLTPGGPAEIQRIERRGSAPGGILVRAGALGPDRPRRDLQLQAEHLLHLRDGPTSSVLAPAGALVNGSSITRLTGTEASDWFAIDLAPHGLVLAENLAVASRRNPSGPLCARLMPPGPGLFALRGRLARGELVEPPLAPPAPPSPPAEAAPPPPQAGEPAWTDPLPAAAAPPLRLLADGIALTPEPAADGSLRVTIPPGAVWLRLVSPPGRPEGSLDSRRFGVAVTRLELDGIPLDLAGLPAGPGFHPLEGPPDAPWRWTDGFARLVLPPSPLPRRLAIGITDWHAMLTH
jgi:hypothetical protein